MEQVVVDPFDPRATARAISRSNRSSPTNSSQNNITLECDDDDAFEVSMADDKFIKKNYSAVRSHYNYRQVSNIRRTKSQHLKDSRTVLRLSLPNPLKPDVKSRMKM